MSQTKKETKDLSFYSYVDPTDVGYKDGGPFIPTKNNRDTVQILSPPMELLWENVKSEAKLGSEFQAKGKTIRNVDRTKIKFTYQVTMGMAGMDDELREIDPAFLKKQREFFVKVYQIGRNALGAVFDNRADEFLQYITKSENDGLKRELDRHGFEGKSEWASIDDVEEAMSKDSALDERVKKLQRDIFIDNATYMFSNPDEYDDDGNMKKVPKGGKNKKITVSANRKVWTRHPHLRSAKKMTAVADWDALKNGTLEQWIKILRAMEEQYTWNPFTFVDGATGKEIQRPMAKNPLYVERKDTDGNVIVSDKSSEKKEITDPYWSPCDKRKSLVQVRFLFSVFTTDSGYGIKTVPSPSITILRQKTVTKGESMYGVETSIATGVVAQTDDETSHKSDSLDDENAGDKPQTKHAKSPQPDPPHKRDSPDDENAGDKPQTKRAKSSQPGPPPPMTEEEMAEMHE